MNLVILADCVVAMRQMPESSVDSIACDPPYGLEFMGKQWDSMGHGNAQQAWHYRWAVEAYRVLKPGGHLVAFGGTRTYHRMASAIEDAGFEIRDSIHWMYGSGFPKSMDVSKAIDKAAGVEREVVSEGKPVKRMIPGADQNNTGSWIKDNGREFVPTTTKPGTTEAEQWEGWGTALKPAHEPIVVARKPLIGTVIKNVLAYGTGALNIDATRVDASGEKLGGGAETKTTKDQKGNEGWTRPWMEDPEAQEAHAERVRANVVKAEALGRWPANIVLSHAPGCVLTGTSVVKGGRPIRVSEQRIDLGTEYDSNVYAGRMANNNSLKPGSRAMGAEDQTVEVYECAPDCPIAALDGEGNGDKGGASRFFPNLNWDGDLDHSAPFLYQAKAAKSERNQGMPDGVQNVHPTVKPVALMRWLVRLVTPPDGTVLDPFMGSGTTGMAAIQEGFKFIGIERDAAYIPIAGHRILTITDQLEAQWIEPESEPEVFTYPESEPEPVVQAAVVVPEPEPQPEPDVEVLTYDGRPRAVVLRDFG